MKAQMLEEEPIIITLKQLNFSSRQVRIETNKIIKEWFLTRIKLKTLYIKRVSNSPICSQPQKVSLIFSIVRYPKFLQSLLSCVSTLEILRIQRVASSLFTSLASRKENHWHWLLLPNSGTVVPTIRWEWEK